MNAKVKMKSAPESDLPKDKAELVALIRAVFGEELNSGKVEFDFDIDAKNSPEIVALRDSIAALSARLDAMSRPQVPLRGPKGAPEKQDAKS